MRSTHSAVRLLGILLLLTMPLASEESLVTISKVSVEPANPGPDTLCKLKVTIENKGDHKVSQFGFDVKLNGQSLSVYGNQLFLYPVDAEGSLEIPLYNFWTTETSRPTMPENGKYVVEVVLREAEWMDISMQTETVERGGESVEEEVEVWTPLGSVEDLPASASITLDATK